MKKYFSILTVLLMLAFATSAPAWNLGYSVSGSQYGDSTGNVTTNTNSFHAVGVLGSGTVSGSNYAGGQALTTHDAPTFTPPLPGDVLVGSATQNFGEAIGGFNYSIQTGNKNFLWIIPPVAGAIAGTKGDVSQWSQDGSYLHAVTIDGQAGSQASQGSAAGFVAADADLLIGKNQGPVTSAFTGDSLVSGGTYSYSYKGQDGATKFIGTVSGAGNSAETTITGGIGSGYAGGSGQTTGGSSIIGTNGSTSGMYAGKFSYSGNGSGSVAGGSQSFVTTLPNGAVYGTSSNVSVNH